MISKDTLIRVRQCCTYISDDGQIAAYVSSAFEPVTAADVARIRNRMSSSSFPNSRQMIPGIDSKAPINDSAGLQMEYRFRDDAREGSARLLKSIAKYHHKRGRPGWKELAA